MKVVLKSISKKYKKNTILENVNLEFDSGHIYGFVGRNGSGKTILMKMICGFINPTDGQIIFDNKVLNKDIKIPPNTRCLIENPSFIPMISGYDNLKLLADITKKIDDDQILSALKDVNLYNDKDKLYYKYSLGMKQKLGIAQAIMENPDILVLDEPFNGIEDESIDKIRKKLLEYKNNGKLIIIASHIKEDMDVLADHIYEVKDKSIKIIK